MAARRTAPTVDALWSHWGADVTAAAPRRRPRPRGGRRARCSTPAPTRTIRDSMHDSDALGWATYFKQPEVIALLGRETPDEPINVVLEFDEHDPHVVRARQGLRGRLGGRASRAAAASCGWSSRRPAPRGARRYAGRGPARPAAVRLALARVLQAPVAHYAGARGFRSGQEERSKCSSNEGTSHGWRVRSPCASRCPRSPWASRRRTHRSSRPTGRQARACSPGPPATGRPIRRWPRSRRARR